MPTWIKDVSEYSKMLKEDGFPYKNAAEICGESGEELFAKYAVKNGFDVYGFSQKELLVEVIDGYVLNKKKRFPVQVKSLKARNAHFLNRSKVRSDVIYVFVRTDIHRFCILNGSVLKASRNKKYFTPSGGIYSDSKLLLRYENNWDIFS